MDETIKLLREQSVLCAHLPELFDELIRVMQSNSPDVQEIISKIETTIRSLSANEKRVQDFLRRVNASSLAEYIAAQEENLQREMAQKLLSKSFESQHRLKRQVEQLKLLLQRGKDYVAFNLNILANISASDTYGAAAQTDSRRSRRMFEANI